jgi:phosphatidylserine/phosphatidylglycerophosphate/cardiolipin synthase-like enzyme
MIITRTSPLALALLFLLAAGQPALAKPSISKTQPRVDVLFSPGGGCTEAIVAAIAGARESVEVQAYSFTSAPIAKAVADAHKRGVKVRVVLDKSQRTERYTSATFLHNAGVPVWIDAGHAIAHNKIILIDRSIILTGSFNFTKSAEERNAENVLFIQGHPELTRKYAANFEAHLAHADPYEGLAGGKGGSEFEPITEENPAPQRKPAARRSRKAA